MLSAHDNPEFQAMCRENEIEGTAMVALCGLFWDRSRAALTSAPAEPDAYNRRLRAQLEQEWADVRRLKKAYTPAETPPAAGAIDARGQEALYQISSLLTSMFVSARAHVQGDDEIVVGYTVRTGALHKIVGILASYKPVIIPSNLPTAHETITGILTGTSAAREEAPAAAGAAQAVVERFERAVSNCTKLHTEYMGKAMSDQAYDTFATLRDETIPALRKELLVALAATPAPQVGKYPQMPSPRFKPTKGLLAGTELFTIKEMYAAYDLGRASLKAALPVEREEGK